MNRANEDLQYYPVDVSASRPLTLPVVMVVVHATNSIMYGT